MLTAFGTMLATTGLLRLLAGLAVADGGERRQAWLWLAAAVVVALAALAAGAWSPDPAGLGAAAVWESPQDETQGPGDPRGPAERP